MRVVLFVASSFICFIIIETNIIVMIVMVGIFFRYQRRVGIFFAAKDGYKNQIFQSSVPKGCFDGLCYQTIDNVFD